MTRLHYFLGLLIPVILYSCSQADSKETGSYKANTSEFENVNTINHFNVIIAPDLSNRLTVYKKPVTDNEIIGSVLEAAYPDIATYRRKMNQMDKYRLDIINSRQIVEYKIDPKSLSIDLSKFKTQIERINYIAPFSSNSMFKRDKEKLKSEFTRLTNSIKKNTAGSDIWTYLNEGLDSYKIETTVKKTAFGKNTYRNVYKNVVLLFTDGYLESSNAFGSGKKNKNLTQSMIENFRNDYKAHNRGRDLKTFFKESGYGITPLNNPLLKYVDILVLEMYDRSLSMSGATKSPTDMEIMKLFWEDWLKASGVRKCDFLPVTPTAAEARARILNFMNIK